MLMPRIPQTHNPAHIKMWQDNMCGLGFTRHAAGLMMEARIATNVVRYEKALALRHFEKALQKFRPRAEKRICGFGWKVGDVLPLAVFRFMMNDVLVFCRSFDDIVFAQNVWHIFEFLGARAYFDKCVWDRLLDLAADRIHASAGALQ
jgi:hypothetical protein